MPNENARVCRCNFSEDGAQKARGTISGRKPTRNGGKNGKHEKRVNPARRARSAERAESHYTYIDSGSSIVGSGIRENTIPEAIYATIPDDPYSSIDGSANGASSVQRRHIYAIPSITSPPPTYDMAIAEALHQSGLPPTYDECLCHKHSSSRSHTPPPPWSESAAPASTSNYQARRGDLGGQLTLREFLIHLSQENERIAQSQSRQAPNAATAVSPASVPSAVSATAPAPAPAPAATSAAVMRDNSRAAVNQQALWEQQVRAQQQRARQAPPARSQSETRAQQQRMAMKHDYGAFCMETQVLQSALEQGLPVCSLM